jgi:DNA-nicking Smr family endonuclease
MSGRRRGVSDEERAFFRTALKDVKSIGRQRERVVHAVKPQKIRISHEPAVMREPIFAEHAAPGLDGHVQAHLRRGRAEPEARFDLHGFSQAAGYRALVGFLLRAQEDGKRLVLIITGKGGVLRERLPFWLGQKDLDFLVGGISEAHAKHGGSGAFYVRLRKEDRRRR